MTLLKPFIVGIDPGVSTGLAIWVRKDNSWTWSEWDFFTVQEHLERVFGECREAVKIFVEHPFGGHVKTKKAKALGEGQQDVFMGNAGGNRREAELLAASLLRQKWDVELVPPVREAKWTAQEFKLFTGSSKSASQHCRDAVRLAHVYRTKRELEGRISHAETQRRKGRK